MRSLTFSTSADAVPIWPVDKAGFERWLGSRPAAVAAWVRQSGFQAKAGDFVLVPDGMGGIAGVVVGVSEKPDLWSYAPFTRRLPAGTYRIDAVLDRRQATAATVGWALADYAFDRYKGKKNGNGTDRAPATLAVPAAADAGLVRRTVTATRLVRDLVNEPAERMGPAELAAAAATLARDHNAGCDVIVGDELLARNFPAVHAIGRASVRPPRLIDIAWGEADAPKVTLVGKGVCFDSGGLDLKPASAMRLMKKDMGGAATVLGLAHMIMDAGLRVRLRVLIPAVENAVAGNALRPGDIIPTRRGLSVEIGNTDAEGRVILADALTLADGETPELLIDCATLTGAARTALGPDIPAFFTPDDEVAAALARTAESEADPLWRLPLWAPYREYIETPVADVNNSSDSGFAGAITAALFLREFVAQTKPWIHVDLYAWNAKARPGRPSGGEAMGLRALYALISDRFA
jgi:leucyl aminopeptidase